MDRRRFEAAIRKAEGAARLGTPTEAAYWNGYCRGLRRAHYGESFGTAEEHKAWLLLGGDPVREAGRRGYQAGLGAGGKPWLMVLKTGRGEHDA